MLMEIPRSSTSTYLRPFPGLLLPWVVREEVATVIITSTDTGHRNIVRQELITLPLLQSISPRRCGCGSLSTNIIHTLDGHEMPSSLGSYGV